jgi:hypothetical protein
MNPTLADQPPDSHATILISLAFHIGTRSDNPLPSAVTASNLGRTLIKLM